MEERTIGSYLRQLRESKKISLADVLVHTKIPACHIEAIEAEEFEKLPAPAYARGFLKTYAEYLGADKEWVVQEYSKSHMAESKQVLVIEGESMEKRSLWETLKSVDKKIWMGIGGGILFLIIIFRLLFHTSVSSIMKDEIRDKDAWKPQSQVIKPHGVSVPEIVNVPAVNGKLVLQAAATDNVWMRIHSDGKLVFEQILKKGDKETWSASKELKVRIGNLDNASFEFNGQPVTNIKPTGKVLNIRFTEKGWWTSD